MDKLGDDFKIFKDPLVKDLYSNVPEFNEMADHLDDDLPYVVFGELSLKLFEDIISNSEITGFTEKCFRYFNRLGDKNDSEIDNLLIVGIYEALYANKKCNRVARKLLIGRNKDVYEHWMINGNIRSDY